MTDLPPAFPIVPNPPRRRWWRYFGPALLLSVTGHLLLFSLFTLKPPPPGFQPPPPELFQFAGSEFALPADQLPIPGEPPPASLSLPPAPPLELEREPRPRPVFRYPDLAAEETRPSFATATPLPPPAPVPEDSASPRWQPVLELEWSPELAARARPLEPGKKRQLERIVERVEQTPVRMALLVDDQGRVLSALAPAGLPGSQRRQLAAACREIRLAPRLILGSTDLINRLETGQLILHR